MESLPLWLQSALIAITLTDDLVACLSFISQNFLGWDKEIQSVISVCTIFIGEALTGELALLYSFQPFWVVIISTLLFGTLLAAWLVKNRQTTHIKDFRLTIPHTYLVSFMIISAVLLFHLIF